MMVHIMGHCLSPGIDKLPCDLSQRRMHQIGHPDSPDFVLCTPKAAHAHSREKAPAEKEPRLDLNLKLANCRRILPGFRRDAWDEPELQSTGRENQFWRGSWRIELLIPVEELSGAVKEGAIFI